MTFAETIVIITLPVLVVVLIFIAETLDAIRKRMKP